MAKDPQYVKLADRLVRSLAVDPISGWGVSGLDIKEFPDESRPAAQSWARTALQRGVLEHATAEEYDVVHGSDDHDYLKQAGVLVKPPEVEGFFQEAHVLGLSETRRHEIEASRGFVGDGLSYKDDEVRRAAVLAHQKAIDEAGSPEALAAAQAEEEDQGSDSGASEPSGAVSASASKEKAK